MNESTKLTFSGGRGLLLLPLLLLLLLTPPTAQVDDSHDILENTGILKNVSPFIIPDLLKAGRVDASHYQPGTIHIVVVPGSVWIGSDESGFATFHFDFELQGTVKLSDSASGRGQVKLDTTGRNVTIASGCATKFRAGGPQAPQFIVEYAFCAQYM